MNNDWVPISLFFFICIVLSLFLYWRYLSKVKRLDTVVKLAERSGEVNPSMIQLLNQESGPTADLRKGLIWIAIGLPLTLGIMLNERVSEAVFGLIPVLIGVAYLIVMKYGYKKDDSFHGIT